jgi:drug/metabolite transporter (DMT)-like permease
VLALLLALGAAFGWGTSDFIGGLKSRSNSVLSVLLVSQVTALCLLATFAIARSAPFPGGAVTWFAALAGVAELVAIAALYRGLSVGAMSIVAPVASTAPVIPLLADLARGESPAPLQLVGIAVALLGLVILSVDAGGTTGATRGRGVASGIGYGLLAAAGFGTYFIAMDSASESDVGWALLTARAAAVALLLVVVVAARHKITVIRGDVLAVAAVGALIVVADALYAIATTRGLVSVVAILGSLHTVVTVMLAAIVLRERIGRVRWVGIVTAMAGAIAIAAG